MTGHCQTHHMTRVNRKSQKRRNKQSSWQPGTQVSESSSHIANVVLFAIHHARSSCYIPTCQTGSPQVCWLSNVVKPREQRSYSFGLLIYQRREGSQLGHAVFSVEQYVNHRGASERRDLARGVRGFCMVARGRKLQLRLRGLRRSASLYNGFRERKV